MEIGDECESSGLNDPVQLESQPVRRLELANFPTAFEDVLLEALLQRSAVLRTQRDEFAEDGSNDGLELPVGFGGLWIRCVMTPPEKLLTLDDNTLTQFFQVRQVSNF
jgi:hypothetical protein